MADDAAAIERAAVAAIARAAEPTDGDADAKMTDANDILDKDEQTSTIPTEKTHADSSAAKGDDDDDDDDDDEEDVDAQLEAMKRRLEDVEAQREKLVNGSTGGAVATPSATKPVNGSAAPVNGAPSRASVTDVDAAIAESDARSIYVGNVDYGATVEELGKHFADCGTINRVTIMCNKATGMPKGYAYIEFADESSVKHAIILDGTAFRDRKIKVTPKRTNVPGLSFRGRRPRYRGGRGYGRRGRRGFRGRWAPY